MKETTENQTATENQTVTRDRQSRGRWTSASNAAYDALQMALAKNPKEAAEKIDGYTQDQRFFLNWARVWRGSTREQRQLVLLNADPHSPTQFRAIGAPSNMPAFAQAFSCKTGDAMVRNGDKQVKIW